jgi:PIN domain nuclease of toxin-antitoxin system
MHAICDTHVLLFWADQPKRLSKAARTAVERGIDDGALACADISLWEIAMLYARGRINNQAGVTATDYIRDILAAMTMTVLPITPEIAELAQGSLFTHGDPADRLIAATALMHRVPLVSADEHLRAVPGLRCIW